MKYCEKCRAIFGNEKKSCPKCGKKLTSDIYPENLVYMTTATGFELERIEAALNEASVPFECKSIKRQAVMRLLNSAPPESYDILAPIFAYDDAYSILAGINAINPDEITEPDEDLINDIKTERKKHNETVDSISPQKQRMIKIFSAIAFLLILAFVVWGTDYITALIKQALGF